jgi:prepilin-type N-terminal cleavage/methylation domain-containing protein
MPRRHAFTLLELLVVMTIIGLLASMLLFGLSRVQSQARTSRTKTTIVKLDELLRRRWDSYATRRVPVDTRGMSPRDATELRLVALRQLMRLEMPDRWIDVTTGPTQLTRIDGSAFTTPPAVIARPALSEAYLRYYNSVSVGKTSDGKPTAQFQNAECLYMMLTVGVMDDASGRELFAESEIGDVDGDGAPEFLDAWGMPIRYLRWPVGFVDDPRQDASGQALFGHLSDLMPAKAPANAAAPLTPCMPDAVNQHDPFDPRGIDPIAFRLVPLIYSAGPDRIEDILSSKTDTSGNELPANDDPFADLRADTTPCATYNPITGKGKLLGIPNDLSSYRNGAVISPNGTLNHYDNIHNHRIDATLR